MAKMTAVLVALIGLLLVFVQLEVLSSITQYNGWLIALSVLAIGVGKVIRNYKLMK